MGTLTRDCPHCFTKNVSFSAFAEQQKLNERNRNFIAALYCGHCYGGYIAELRCETSSVATNTNGNIENNQYIHITKEYPIAKSIKAPQYLPQNIENFYLQAANSLKAGSLDASAIMSRKVLEVSVKALLPTSNGNLYNRIEALANEGLITSQLKDWAHIIRDDGNGAAHEESPVEAEFAQELLSFAEMFLMYTFTMPGMISERQQEVET